MSTRPADSRPPDSPPVDLRHHGDAELADAPAGLVDLAVNVTAGGPPGWLRAVLREALDEVGRYPDPRPAVAAVAARHGCAPGEVLLTSGAAEAFVLLARVLRPRSAVVVHPQFTEPEAALRAAGHPVRRLSLAAGDGFRLDPRRVPAGADLVVVGNPTNPTSVLHPAADLRRLARPGRVLVVDEAFMDAVPGEPETLLDGPAAAGVVVVRSLTKTWALPGLRAGYLICPPDLRARLAAAQPLWPVSTPALAAVVACCGWPALVEAERRADEVTAGREYLRARLAELGIEVAGIPRGPFVLLRIPGGPAVREVLRARGYAVRRGDTFPGLGPDWLRVAVRAPAVTDGFVTVLRDVLQEVWR
ncbi:MAG: Rv2231c family pyridoxal phosphate-dependent protein CobC [Mycobacteriales bacterium]